MSIVYTCQKVSGIKLLILLLILKLNGLSLRVNAFHEIVRVIQCGTVSTYIGYSLKQTLRGCTNYNLFNNMTFAVIRYYLIIKLIQYVEW